MIYSLIWIFVLNSWLQIIRSKFKSKFKSKIEFTFLNQIPSFDMTIRVFNFCWIVFPKDEIIIIAGKSWSNYLIVLLTNYLRYKNGAQNLIGQGVVFFGGYFLLVHLKSFMIYFCDYLTFQYWFLIIVLSVLCEQK